MPTALPAGVSVTRLRDVATQLVFVTCLAVLVGACSGEAGRSNATADNPDTGPAGAAPTGPVSITGLVGNPSLSDAEVKLLAPDGSLLATSTSDTSASYAVTLEEPPPLPLRAEARDGRSLVSGLASPIVLSAVAFNPTTTLNASFLSTLAIRTAECGGPLTDQTLARGWSLVSELSGLDDLPDPAGHSLPVEQTARLLRADSGFEEALRRTSAALAAGPIAADQIVDAVGCDLADDGRLNLSPGSANSRALLTFMVARTATLLELIGRQPYIDGQAAAVMLDATLADVLPNGAALQGSVVDLPVSATLVEAARQGLAMLIADVQDPELLELLQALASSGSLRDTVRQRLDAAHLNVLWSLPARLAGTDAATIDRLRSRVIGLATAARPIVSFAVSENQVPADETITLSWASAEADRCLAFGDWSGERPLQGAYTTPPLSSSASYGLTCSGLGGTTTLSRAVSVTSGDQAPPTLSLSAAPATVDSGDTAEVSWSATNASSCQAGDGWSGGRSTSGTETVGPLNATTTFSLACTGPGGSVTRTTTVTVNSAPAPSVSMTASEAIVDPGATTTLTWSSSNATSCSASGAWSGARPTAGSAVVGPLSTRSTFSISCSGSGGTALAMVAVRVNGPITLSWVAPTENVDGSPLTDLAAYRVYWGESSRAYTGQRQIDDPIQTSTTITLPSGDYFVAMTALDAEGNESAYSNEVLKSTP